MFFLPPARTTGYRMPTLPRRRHRIIALGILYSSLVAACTDGSAGNAASPGDRVALQPSSQMAQAQTGLNQLPRPQSTRALNEAMDRHYPAGLRAERRRGSVLVDIDIDREGRVRDVRPITPISRETHPNGLAHRAVLLEEDPKTGKVVERELDTNYDPAFVPAARSALREVRFSPAIRNGEAVAYTLRMSLDFAAPAASQ